MANQKHYELISELNSLLGNDEDKLICKQITEFLLGLGYIPKKQKGKGFALDFKNNKLNEKIAKLGIGNNNCLNASMKFYASDNYSQKFKEGLQGYCDWLFTDAGKKYVNEIDGKYISCGCGKCNGFDGAYKYEYPDGKFVIRCGKELVRVRNLTVGDIGEIIRILEAQHNFFIKNASASSR